MSLEPKILNYIHHHQLTNDSEWTLDLASELIHQLFSNSINSASPQNQTEKEIKVDLVKVFTNSMTISLDEIIDDHWMINSKQVLDLKECLKKLKKPLRDEEIQLSNDDFFYQRLAYLNDEFLLRLNSIRPQSIKSKTLQSDLKVQKVLNFNGKNLIKISSEEEEEEEDDLNLENLTVEDLIDAKPSGELEQVLSNKELMVRASEPWLGFEDLPIQFEKILLEDSLFIETLEPTCLSPPMMPREFENKGLDLMNEPKEMARLIINSMEEMEMTDSQPELSNELWDELDPFPRFSLTPPSSPPTRIKEKSIEISNVCLIAKENEEIVNGLKSENPILETVLFPRHHHHHHLHSSDQRSNSFDPSSYLNLRPFKPIPSGKTKKEGKDEFESIEVEDSNDHQVFKELESVLEKSNGQGDYENERFERPEIITGKPSKRVKMNAARPRSPGMRQNTKPNMYRPNLEGFGLAKVGSPKGRISCCLPQEVSKVEGLRSLNIDLSWTPYTFPESLKVERLIDVEEAPEGCIAEMNSSDRFEQHLLESSSLVLSDQERITDSSRFVKRSKEDFPLLEFSSWSTSNQPLPNLDQKVDEILDDEVNSRSTSIIESDSITEAEVEASLRTSKIEERTETGLGSDDEGDVRFEEIEIDGNHTWSPSIGSMKMSEGLDFDSIQSISPIPERHLTERHRSFSNLAQDPIRQNVFDSNHYVNYYPSFLDHGSKPEVSDERMRRSEKTSSQTVLKEKNRLTEDYEDSGIGGSEMKKRSAQMMYERREINEQLICDETRNPFERVEENKMIETHQSGMNEERNLTDFSTGSVTLERNPSDPNLPILREKLSDRLRSFMKSRQVITQEIKDHDDGDHDSEEIKLDPEVKRKFKLNESLPILCPPPPISIQDSLYLPVLKSSFDELKANEKLIMFYYSMRMFENRLLKVQLERYFRLEESDEDEDEDWETKGKVLKADLGLKDEGMGSEIGILFMRLSKLISGSYKVEEIEKIKEGEEEEEMEGLKKKKKKGRVEGKEGIQEACFTSVYRLSKRYSRLLIIFEAYPIKPMMMMIKDKSNERIAYAYTPPILKSLNVLKKEIMRLEEEKKGLGDEEFKVDLSVAESDERAGEIGFQWVQEVLHIHNT
ncbi:hypothetical protein DFH28DRAFT_1181262 [Melampsora americana]|nr:hypothetical protein DFH28DRAFT_1181262 [Melampsora americana]